MVPRTNHEMSNRNEFWGCAIDLVGKRSQLGANARGTQSHCSIRNANPNLHWQPTTQGLGIIHARWGHGRLELGLLGLPRGIKTRQKSTLSFGIVSAIIEITSTRLYSMYCFKSIAFPMFSSDHIISKLSLESALVVSFPHEVGRYPLQTTFLSHVRVRPAKAIRCGSWWQEYTHRPSTYWEGHSPRRLTNY